MFKGIKDKIKRLLTEKFYLASILNIKAKENRKILLCVTLLFVVIITFVYFLNKDKVGHFKTIGFVSIGVENPILLNENELLFVGGWDGKYSDKTKTLPVKIYNIKTNNVSKLNAYMNVPRASYSAFKYNKENVLILGGLCSPFGKKPNELGECYKTAENYNIANNKFEILEKLPMPCDYNTQFQISKEEPQKLFVITNRGIMVFDTKSKKFKKLIEFEEHFNSVIGSVLYKNNIIIWNGVKVVKYNEKLNTITTLLSYKGLKAQQVPISAPGVLLDGNRVLFVPGDENVGTVYIYDYSKNKIENHGQTKFGVNNASGVYLGNDKVLLINGTIKGLRGLFGMPVYIEHAILDLKTNKMSQVRKIHYKEYNDYIVKLDEHKIFINKKRCGINITKMYKH